MDFSNVVVQEDISETDSDLATLTNEATSPGAVPTIWTEVSIISLYNVLPFKDMHSNFHITTPLMVLYMTQAISYMVLLGDAILDQSAQANDSSTVAP